MGKKWLKEGEQTPEKDGNSHAVLFCDLGGLTQGTILYNLEGLCRSHERGQQEKNNHDFSSVPQ